jgi:hypothetical protein
VPDPNVQHEERQQYEAKTSSGTPYTVNLTPTDAKRLGLIPGDDEARVADASGEQADSPVQPADDADAKARTSSNKARSTSTK